jgi:hypothetical protein
MSATTGTSRSAKIASRKYGDSARAALEQALVLVDVERGEAGGTGGRMAGIRVPVEELDRAVRRGAHDRVVDALAHRHGAHRLRAVGEALRHRQQVGRDTEALRGERLSRAAEAADHFVEHQQDAVRIADLAQAHEVALRRHEAAARPGDRLDEAGGDVLGAIEIHEPEEILGELDAMRAFALREVVFLEMRMPHVCDRRQPRPELAAVVDETGQRDAAKADAVVGALARDKHVAPALAAGLVIGKRDLHRRVDRLGAGIDEKDPVEVTWRELRDARRELELLRMRAQERRAEIELLELRADPPRRSPSGRGRRTRRTVPTTHR